MVIDCSSVLVLSRYCAADRRRRVSGYRLGYEVPAEAQRLTAR
ncbi:hypothetical protein M2284_003543 [Rhodococcus sp. LBL1]|uniref:Uncharacterized protein n=1 Tax=Prescottella agglutinans TaxID=1644129 RepID=A0ABT6M664_9NOCA|nr:hypothetical protein [Prescottella agglutinans]MDH6679321.1 hypothetical protein [Rhodococcus sp. LBL1]MDH6685538.1 hypothetical protein [Rhodococcus sp. LBL2]